MDRQKEIRKYRRLIELAGIAAIVATFGSFFVLATYFALIVAYMGSAAIGAPFLLVLWRLDNRYGDLQFRDDL
jgi:hypothetical protein